MKENAKYKIMVRILDNSLHDTYTCEYNGVIYDSWIQAVYELKKARNVILNNRRVCDVFLQEVEQ